MSDDELLDEVLLRWEEEYDRGRDLSPAELCRDCPHLAGRAAEEIAKLKCMRIPTDKEPPIPAPVHVPVPPPQPPVKAFEKVRYTPLRHHASGGLGDVFVALDQEAGREVALKRIQTRHANRPDVRGSFEREAEITGRLEHPGVVPLYGRGKDAEDQPFYAMRFIRGQSLKGAIEEFYRADSPKRDPGERSVAFRGLLQRFTSACNAVAYAHSRGVIHRDIKPANMMLGPYGETLVVDWGLAKYVGRDAAHGVPAEDSVRPAAAVDGGDGTPAGAVVGTVAFMSPEQARGDLAAIGPASDVFSLGATLYQILTGRTPYQGKSAFEDAKEGKFPRPRQVRRDVSRAPEAVCLKAMALRPQDRYATAQELARDVDRWLADEPTTAYREPWRVRAWRWVKRHRTPVAATAAALLVAALLVGGGLWRAAQAAQELRQDVAAALDEASRWVAQGRWEEAEPALARANGRLAGGGPGDLRNRAGQIRADLDMARRLEDLAIRAWEVSPWDRKPLDEEYAAAFREYQLPLETLDREEAIKRIQMSAIREPLIEAMDRWLDLKQMAGLGGAEPMLAVVQGADSANDWRNNVRDLTAHGDRKALEELAEDKEMLKKQAPDTLADLGVALFRLDAKEAGLKLLREAQLRAPGALRTNLVLALALTKPGSAGGDEVPAFLRAALASRPRNPFLHIYLGNALLQQGKWEEAEAAYRRAIDLKDDPEAHNSLGALLEKKGEQYKAEAEAQYRRAIELKDDDPKFHYNLANLLFDKGEPAEAKEEYLRALGRKENFPDAHYGLAMLLSDKGEPDEAEKHYRRAIVLKKGFTDARYNLGVLLQEQGRFAEAVESMREARDPLSRDHPLRPVIESDVSLCERLLELDKKLPAILNGAIQPGDPAERVEFALFLGFKRHYAAAACFYEKAFKLVPLADDLESCGLRYNAACVAVLAGLGQGEGVAALDDKMRADWRNQALEWLRANITAWDKRRQDDPKARPAIQHVLKTCKRIHYLAGVRDADALKKLPEAEREAWQKLWADVDALLVRVGAPKQP